MGKGYKNCVYDKFTNTIFYKEVNDLKYRRTKYINRCYISDVTKESEIKDIYGNPVKLIDIKDPSSIGALKRSNVVVCESDLNQEVKWMHQQYDFETLESDVNDFRICFYDIETQTATRQSRSTKVLIKNPFNNLEREMTLREYDSNKELTEKFLIYDEIEKKFVKYIDSCYFVTEFPDPNQAKYPINLITCWSSDNKKTYTWGLEPYTGNNPVVTNYNYFEDEYELLSDWVDWFHEQYFDIFTGWNSDRFDLPYIVNRILNLEKELNILPKDSITKKISPLKKQIQTRNKVNKKGDVTGIVFSAKGLYTFDYMDVYKKFSGRSRLPRWSLDYVAELELQEKKLEYDGKIYEIYKYDWNKYVEYNVQDVNLLVKLEEKKKMFGIMIELAYDCVINLDRVFSMIATVEGYALKFMHKEKLVMSDRKENERDWWLETNSYKVKRPDGNIEYQNCYYEEKGLTTFEPFFVKAGYCYASPGRYKWAMSGDIKSSYPHHMMMYNLSTEVKVIDPTQEEIINQKLIKTDINKVYFRSDVEGILAKIVRVVFEEREYFNKQKKKYQKLKDNVKAQFFDVKQNNKKTIINSCYGVSLNKQFHLFDIDVARCITRSARCTIRYIKETTNNYYVSDQIKRDIMKHFPTVTIEYGGQIKKFKKNEEITIMRNNKIMKIKAYEFNKDTDLLGIE